MARPLWNGTISFGLVTIPIGVHTAVKDLGPHFHLLRESDQSRIKYEKVAENDHKPVSKDELVKGYEYEKGHFVVLDERDFEKAALHKDQTIDIIDFVEAKEIDDRYFDKPYYLVPGPGGAKAYALLRDALKKSGRIGIAKFVLRSKQYLAAVEPIRDALVLTTMRFEEELVGEDAFDFPSSKGLRAADLKLAEQLIESLAAPWKPGQYTNDYRQNLIAVIEAKRKNRRAKLEAPEEPSDQKVVDLMERLRRSLGQSGRTRGSRRAGAAHQRSRSTRSSARHAKWRSTKSKRTKRAA
jgi:DNA end-binding protein Ku